MDVTAVVEAIRPGLARALVATDLDGTLAPLELDPTTSRLVPGALDALQALSDAGAQVAVITGRMAATAVRLGGLDAVPGIVVAGLYGAQTWHDGRLDSPDPPAQMRVVRDRLPGAIAGGDPQLWIEDKGLSLVVHARRCHDSDVALAAVQVPVTDLAHAHGLEVHPGSDVLELRIPGYDKAGALNRLAAGHASVLFLGDDLGDLPAFEQIRALRAAGVTAWGVGVLASGVTEVATAADVTVPDPAAAVAILQALTR